LSVDQPNPSAHLDAGKHIEEAEEWQ